jgi:hypothetical protein
MLYVENKTTGDVVRGDQSFLPTDYDFEWIEGGNWYKWDYKRGHLLAKQARDARAKELTRAGYKVKKSTSRNNLISKGGAGSGRAHLEFVVTAYILEVVG